MILEGFAFHSLRDPDENPMPDSQGECTPPGVRPLGAFAETQSVGVDCPSADPLRTLSGPVNGTPRDPASAGFGSPFRLLVTNAVPGGAPGRVGTDFSKFPNFFLGPAATS